MASAAHIKLLHRLQRLRTERCARQLNAARQLESQEQQHLNQAAMTLEAAQAKKNASIRTAQDCQMGIGSLSPQQIWDAMSRVDVSSMRARQAEEAVQTAHQRLMQQIEKVSEQRQGWLQQVQCEERWRLRLDQSIGHQRHVRHEQQEEEMAEDSALQKMALNSHHARSR